ncbi:hypothetical protein CHUAL_014259 [Chamberlinius hualienensis]
MKQLILITLYSIFSVIAGIEPVTDDALRLRNELFNPSRYDANNAPNVQNNEVLKVSIKIIPMHVYDINEYNGVMTVNGWFLSNWEDHRLVWNMPDYGNNYFLRVPQHSVWLPDLTLYNNAEAIYMNNVGYAQVIVLHDGNVYWGAPTTLHSTCSIDHKYFPFDQHFCSIDVGSWSSAFSMSLEVHYVDALHEADILKNFGIENPLWEVFSRKDEVVNKTYECCPNSPVPYFQLELGLRRRAPFYKFLILTPSVIAMLLTLTVFWIPIHGHNAAKLYVGGLATVILVIVLLFLAYHIPPGGKHIPAIVLFCGNSLVMSSLTVLTTVAIMKITRQSRITRQVPETVKTVSNFIVKCCCSEQGQTHLWTRFISSVRNPASDIKVYNQRFGAGHF